MKHQIFLFGLLLAVAAILVLPAAAQTIGGDQGYFLISSSPSGASLIFDGSYKGTTPVTVAVYTTADPTHTVQLTKSGYYDYTDTIYGNPDPDQTIPYSYTMMFIPVTPEPTITIGGGTGYYQISSVPSGANVYFDGTYRGTTPVTVEVYTTGTPGHNVRWNLPGYQDAYQSLSGNPPEGQTIPVNAYLTPVTPVSQYGNIYVTSSPSGAVAYLDGSRNLVTPNTFTNVLTGSHTVRFSLSGYQDVTRSVTVYQGDTSQVSVSMTPLSPTSGSIYATSVPQGALVYVDGAYYGPSPQLASGLAPGYHQVRLTLSGFQDWVGQVMVSSGKTTQVSQTLTVSPTGQPTVIPGTGTLQISSTPSGAAVYVDNAYMGVTPVTLSSISAGSHVVSLQLTGYANWGVTAQVAAGQTTPIAATLTPVAVPTTKAPLPAFIVIGSLAAAALLLLSRRDR